MARKGKQSEKQDKCSPNERKYCNILLALETQLLIVVFQKDVSVSNITGDCTELIIHRKTYIFLHPATNCLYKSVTSN
jgi:hypothetical protein